MKKIDAFTPDFDGRILLHTARAAREAEFDNLVGKLFGNLPAYNEEGLRRHLAGDLRGGIYNNAADAFLKIADYLRTHRLVLSGKELDPDEHLDTEASQMKPPKYVLNDWIMLIRLTHTSPNARTMGLSGQSRPAPVEG